jgi:hypothetical protein
MLTYRRVRNPDNGTSTVVPLWINTVTGKPEILSWEQIKRGGDIPSANQPFEIKGVRYNYTRINWWPFYTQKTDTYINPRMLKPDGTRITDNDWYYQGE